MVWGRLDVMAGGEGGCVVLEGGLYQWPRVPVCRVGAFRVQAPDPS